MGGIFSRKKGKESFPELLTSLTKDISALENRQNHLHRQHRLLTLFTFLSLVLYVALVGGYVFYIGIPKSPVQIGVSVGSLALIWIMRFVFKFVIGYRASGCESKLTELREQKKDVLSRVMDEVPYKTAKDLLEKYDPQSPHLRVPHQAQQQAGQRQATAAPGEGSTADGVRQRRPDAESGGRPLSQGVAIQQQQQLLQQQQMLQHQHQVIAGQERRLRAQQERLRQVAASGEDSAPAMPEEPLPVYELKPGDVAGPAPGPPKPKPILPRERSSVDKMVEFLVGDGPNNRYALICKSCNSHNGMALPSEYEYCTFRCAYCYELNPARKQVPTLHGGSDSSSQPQLAASVSGFNRGDDGNTATGQVTEEVSPEDDGDPSTAGERAGDADDHANAGEGMTAGADDNT